MALVNPMLLTALTPSMSGTWLRMMSTPMPVRKPSITKWETNRRYRPMWANAATTMIRPASGVRRIRPSGRCFTATPARAEAARQRRRARRRDHHQSGAGREPASDQSGEAGLKAVDRLDAGQDAGRHAVPDTADRTWQDREDVGLEVCPAWPHGGQPRRPPARARAQRGFAASKRPRPEPGAAGRPSAARHFLNGAHTSSRPHRCMVSSCRTPTASR